MVAASGGRRGTCISEDTFPAPGAGDGDLVKISNNQKSLWNKHLQVNTGDSRSCTSLSIWISMLTVISSSALLRLAWKYRMEWPNVQDLKQIVCLLVRLCKKTQGEGSHSIVAPRAENSNEKCLPILLCVSGYSRRQTPL